MTRRADAEAMEELEPRDGPAGRRGVVEVREGGEVALWQSKTPQLHRPTRGPQALRLLEEM
jgi:hypothetical protein